MNSTTISLDIAKNVFQVHGVDAKGKVVLRKLLRRAQVLEVFANLEPCLIGLEACAGAHYWARELGHEVRLMSPQFVKPYVKGHPSADGREMSWESPLPSGMTQLLEALYEDARGLRSGTRPPWCQRSRRSARVLLRPIGRPRVAYAPARRRAWAA